MLSFQSSFVNGFGLVPHGERGQAVLEARGDLFCSALWLLGGKDGWPKWGAYKRRRSLCLGRSPAALFGIEFLGALREHEEAARSPTPLGILFVLRQSAAPCASWVGAGVSHP